MTAGVGHCLLHPDREAVARCPECRQPCCRECVTEHEGRFLCATCLRRRSRAAERRRGGTGWLSVPVQIAAGLVLAAVVFHALGLLLLQVPSEWHEGTAVEREVLGP